MIRRIVLVVGICPLILFCIVRWVWTGDTGEELVERFVKWGMP